MAIKRVVVVAVPVSDPERARTFSVDELGLELGRDDSSVPGLRWIQVAPHVPGLSDPFLAGALGEPVSASRWPAVGLVHADRHDHTG